MATVEYACNDAKPVIPYGLSGSDIKKLRVDALGTTMAMMVNSLVPEEYDSITLSYTGTNLTGVVYKTGLTTVATLTLTYDGSDNLLTITRT